MITRRQAMLAAGAVMGAGAGAAIGLTAGAVAVRAVSPPTGPWTPIASGERAKLNGNGFEAECGPNPVALQLSKSGVVRANIVRGNGWNEDDPQYVERAELDGWPSQISLDAPIWTAWSMYYEKGPWSTSAWCILHQLFQVDGEPLAHVLKPDGMLHWVGSDTTDKPGVWPDRHSHKIEQGTWINFVEVRKFAPETGDGYWKSWVNGQQVLDHHGALGAKGVKACYAKFGLYRNARVAWDGLDPNVGPAFVKENVAVRFANLHFGKEDLSRLIANPDPTPEFEPWG